METKVTEFFAEEINQNLIVPEQLSATDKANLDNLLMLKEALEEDGHRNLRPSMNDKIDDMSERIAQCQISALQNTTLVEIGSNELTLNNTAKTPYRIATYKVDIDGVATSATAIVWQTNLDQNEFKVGQDYLVNHRFRIENGGVKMNSTYTALTGGNILTAEQAAPSAAKLKFNVTAKPVSVAEQAEADTI